MLAFGYRDEHLIAFIKTCTIHVVLGPPCQVTGRWRLSASGMTGLSISVTSEGEQGSLGAGKALCVHFPDCPVSVLHQEAYLFSGLHLASGDARSATDYVLAKLSLSLNW